MLSWGWIFIIARRGGIPISEKHMTRGLIGVLLDVSDELHDGTSHEVWLINLVRGAGQRKQFGMHNCVIM